MISYHIRREPIHMGIFFMGGFQQLFSRRPSCDFLRSKMCFWSWEEMSWTVWDMFKAFATSFRHQNWFFNTKSEQIHVENWWIFAFLRLLWAISFTITFTKGNYAAVVCLSFFHTISTFSCITSWIFLTMKKLYDQLAKHVGLVWKNEGHTTAA